MLGVALGTNRFDLISGRCSFSRECECENGAVYIVFIIVVIVIVFPESASL